MLRGWDLSLVLGGRWVGLHVRLLCYAAVRCIVLYWALLPDCSHRVLPMLCHCASTAPATAGPTACSLFCCCRWIVVPVMIVWSSWASIPFIGGAVPANRRALAVYPLVLLYTAVGWLALIT